MIKRIVVMGIGYVGLPLALMLAKSGFDVIGVDLRKDLIKSVNCGMLNSAEQDIKQLLSGSDVRKNFRAQEVPCKADAFIISVPTPIDERKRIADLSYVRGAAQAIMPYLQHGNLVVLESTVPPLTCRDVLKPILEQSGLKIGVDIFLAHCPERILPGNIVKEIINNNRVIGGVDETSSQMAREIYSSFVKGELYISDDVTAEFVKLMENTYRDVNIALANEFAAVAGTLSIDIVKCIHIANKHPRVKILKPGIGTGGHCIPIDPWFIHEVDPFNSKLIYASRMINEEMPSRIAAKIRCTLKDIKEPVVVALGTTYKPDTDDIRGSPAIKIVSMLRNDGYQVKAYDPLAGGYDYGPIKDLVKDADCLVILVEHTVIKNEFERNEAAIRQAMRRPIIIRFYNDDSITSTSRLKYWSESLRADNELSSINPWRDADEGNEAALRPRIQEISSN